MASKQLLQGFALGSLQLSNRVVLAPLTRGRSGDSRVPNDINVDYYAQRASAGLVITEATAVSEQGYGWCGAPGVYTDEQQAGWKKVTDAVHAKGGKIFLQLWHMGRASHSSFHGGKPPVSASAIAIIGNAHIATGSAPYETPRALEESEIPGVVADYKNAAARCMAAGFDGVEIHAANGYLIDQFMQSKTNQRSDSYGGSIENRARLLKEVVAAVTSVVPADRVGVRLAPNGVYNDMGSPDYREQFNHALSILEAAKVGYVHVMDGLGFGFHKLGEPFTLKDARMVYKGALIGNCGYTQETAEAAVASGDADMIAFGRPYIANPDLVERFANGWPLADAPDMSVWYGGGAAGYSDFPAHKP